MMTYIKNILGEINHARILNHFINIIHEHIVVIKFKFYSRALNINHINQKADGVNVNKIIIMSNQHIISDDAVPVYNENHLRKIHSHPLSDKYKFSINIQH